MSLTETEKNPLVPLDEEESTRPLLKRNNETHKWERVGFETPPQKWRLDSDKTRYVILLTTIAVITGLTFAIIALAGGFNQTEDGDDEDLDSLIPTCGDGKDQPEDPFFWVPTKDGVSKQCACFDPTACAIQCCPWDDPRDEVGNLR
eukprot:CAMPEP_0198199936 /NCGR_PEP_ID=MMETSP1445-20131203/3038_1 /TAXON_ID=36898 /ORGANISM="Pyramimonas sp., Strain CCMP2087" /LENGTH=146 /DNA_ID=CAMNT_0043869847 /DNA_START=200 /DNA_END=640 /DNA_ORIENTATION=+